MPEKEKMNESMLQEKYEKGLALADKWSAMDGDKIHGFEGHGHINFLEGVENDVDKANLAMLYENTYQWLKRMDESTRMMNVGPFEKFVFPILRAMMANLVANDLVTVSPLDASTGLVFYFDVLYGSNKGSVVAGTKMYDVRRGPAQDYHYTDEVVQGEALGVGAAADEGYLAYTPIRPGSVQITDGTITMADNGLGGFHTVPGASVNYATGQIDLNGAMDASVNEVTANYEYNSEGGGFGGGLDPTRINTPEIDLMLSSAPITARRQALRARWSLESQQDFQAYHGINAEVELVTFMANELAKELNYKIVRHIYQVAQAAPAEWERTPYNSVPWIWHKESLYDAFILQANNIFTFTQRAQGNWIVASVPVCNVIETLSRFNREGAQNTSIAGIRKIGSLGEFTIYKDPTMPLTEEGKPAWLMGYKGSSFLDTGYIHAPYLQVYSTPTMVLDDMLARKGMAMRTGQKVVNAGMYSRGQMIQSGDPFGSNPA